MTTADENGAFSLSVNQLDKAQDAVLSIVIDGQTKEQTLKLALTPAYETKLTAKAEAERVAAEKAEAERVERERVAAEEKRAADAKIAAEKKAEEARVAAEKKLRKKNGLQQNVQKLQLHNRTRVTNKDKWFISLLLAKDIIMIKIVAA